MIAGWKGKNSRLGSIVNPLLVLPYEVHFRFGIKPRHSSDRLIGSYVYSSSLYNARPMNSYRSFQWTLVYSENFKDENDSTLLVLLLALISSSKMIERRMSHFYSINISVHAFFEKYVSLYFTYFYPKYFETMF